ncbi:hypothetical protein ACSV5M_01895 [Cellvibrio sp. ARAG 10.3]|uniref:hypothetical protein n=1 Tax=Cellvibrio sp. ARAG 10.3 TaxID=3451358 RepID=UPI003F459BE3
MMKKGLIKLISILAGASVLSISAAYAADAPGRVYYRYVNEEGVKVINATIPPEYVSKGYEVVSLNGEVIRVVEPSPTGEEAERAAEERKLRKQQEKADKLLRRRYSSVADIEAAKTRNLQELQGNISILTSNLSNVQAQIVAQQEQAASIERSGRAVGEDLLKNLAALQAEERDIKLQIKQREREYQAASDKFDQDMKRFEEISRTD